MRAKAAFMLASMLLWTVVLGVPTIKSRSSQKRGFNGDRVYFEEFCTHEQILFEAQAWADALVIADALGQWRPRGKGQAAVDLYMGTDSSQSSFWDRSWYDILHNNIDGALRLFGNGLPITQNLYIFCSEPPNFGGNCGEPIYPFAYTFTDKGVFYDNHYIIFCPRFYNTDLLVSALLKANNGTNDRTQVESFEACAGGIYYHESLHWVGLTSTYAYPVHDSPDGTLKGKPEIYGPAAVAHGAKTYNTAGMVHVSDAYTIAALAMVVQDFFNLTDPPGPPNLTDPSGPPRLKIRSIAFQQTQAYDEPPPFNKSTRPAEFPDPNTVNNTPANPILVLSPAHIALPSRGSQLANIPNPKLVIGTS